MASPLDSIKQEMIALVELESEEEPSSLKEDMIALARMESGEEESESPQGYSTSAEVTELMTELAMEESKESTGLRREFAQGLSFGTFDEVEALVSSIANDTSYSEEKERINKEMEEYRFYNPGTALTAELLGAIPTGFGASGLLSRAGFKTAASQGAVEGGVYGVASGGDTLGERAIGGSIGAVSGGAIGRGADIVTGRLVRSQGERAAPESFNVGEAIDYVKSDGTRELAKVIGEEDGDLILTSDFLSSTPDPSKRFKVSKDSPDINKRYDFDPEDMSVTPIERAVPAMV